jgi:hypothetical protein
MCYALEKIVFTKEYLQKRLYLQKDCIYKKVFTKKYLQKSIYKLNI